MSGFLLPLVAAVLVGRQAPKPDFEPIQPELLSTGGAFTNAFADIDLDGDVDLFVGFNGTANRLYRNDNGILNDIATTAGVADARPTRAAAWGDFDADGDPDLLLGFAPAAGPVLRLYRNVGSRFDDVTAAANLVVDTGAVRQPVWIDMDADDDLDLFVAFRDRPNAFFQNEKGRFTEVAAAIGLADARRSVGASWLDYDEDGDLDLYVGNMDGDANGLYRNERGRFTDVAEGSGIAWGGRSPREAAHGTVRPCAADVDNDGSLDLFTANYGPLGLFLNRRGRFADASAAWQVALDSRYDTCAFADVDHDGRIDVYVNGTVTGGVSFRDHLFHNSGVRFEDITPENLRALEADHGAQWADIDNDGDLDLSLTGARPDGMHLVLRNQLPGDVARRSLQVRVLDGRGHATRAGAEVRVYARGSRQLLGTRIVDSGSGYDAQNDSPVHFGFARTGPVDVQVIFPASGRRRAVWARNVDPATQRVVAVRVPR